MRQIDNVSDDAAGKWQADIACRVIGRHITQESRAQNMFVNRV